MVSGGKSPITHAPRRKIPPRPRVGLSASGRARYLVFLSGCYSTFQRFYHGDTYHPGFYRMTGGQRAAVLVTYGGLVIGLSAGMVFTQAVVRSPQRLARERGRGHRGALTSRRIDDHDAIEW